MKKLSKKTSVAVVTALVFGVVACSSSTVIRSNVQGAKVYLNGEYVGTTPYTMTDTKIVGSTTTVRLEAPGYEPTHGVISRSEVFSIGACIGGVLVLFPFLWIMGYKPEHFFELRPGSPVPRAMIAPTIRPR
ncbi:MAG: PEGA domain-containing protein [Proteobacteria bacterium]|nr:PEGA domain-containing protein [Pseudomonadota bacterium]